MNTLQNLEMKTLSLNAALRAIRAEYKIEGGKTFGIEQRNTNFFALTFGGDVLDEAPGAVMGGYIAGLEIGLEIGGYVGQNK